MEIRKFVTIIEEASMEMGKKISTPHRKVASVAVIINPFAGRCVENLDELVEIGAELGSVLSKRALNALQIEPKDIHNFGKGAIVGLDGQYEHTKRPGSVPAHDGTGRRAGCCGGRQRLHSLPG